MVTKFRSKIQFLKSKMLMFSRRKFKRVFFKPFLNEVNYIEISEGIIKFFPRVIKKTKKV